MRDSKAACPNVSSFLRDVGPERCSYRWPIQAWFCLEWGSSRKFRASTAARGSESPVVQNRKIWGTHNLVRSRTKNVIVEQPPHVCNERKGGPPPAYAINDTVGFLG